MEHIKELLGGVATILAVAGYFPYLRDVVAGKTKPHLFTWIIWTTLATVAVLGQIKGSAGPGAWPSIISALLCIAVLILTIQKGSHDFSKLDFIMLLGALLSLLFWFVIQEPVISIILAVSTDALGFVPTIRKSWMKPYEETASAYIMNAAKHYISLYAMRHYSLLTALYPAYLTIANILFVSLLFARRRAITQR